MYRQHLRITLAKDTEMKKPKSEFVYRISTVPIVYPVCVLCNLVAETYQTVKESNALLKMSFNTTERTMSAISEPIIKRFEKQLKTADYIACQSLQTVQNVIPNLIYQREKIIKQTKDLYEDTIENGLRKLDSVKKLSISKVTDIVNDGNEKLELFLASPYGEACEVAVDFVLDTGELYVDYLLPPLGDESPEKLFGDRGREPMSQRADLLRNRLKERFYKHALLKVQTLKLRTKLFVINIYHFNLYQFFVKTTAAVPELMFSTMFRIFVNLEELLSYIASLFTNQDQNMV